MTAPSINPRIGALGRHPFPRLNALLAPVKPPAQLEPLDLSIGEPRLAPPAITPSLVAHAADWGRYPPNEGPPWFAAAASSWLERRFDLPPGAVAPAAVLPTAGAREALFQLGILVADGGRSALGMPTPHYAPYRAAAMLTGLEPLYLPAVAEEGYLPDLTILEGETGRHLAALLLCSPSNPEGAVASLSYLERAVTLARRQGFVLAVDECYADIYLGAAPTGVLRACLECGAVDGDPFSHVLSFHSLSKRSSAAGLRVGIVSGDRRLVEGFVALRAYCGGTTPLPNLGAAADLLGDEHHVVEARAAYRETFAVADEILDGVPGYRRPEAGMFLWLSVEHDETAAVAAWREAALRVVPGSFLGPPGWNSVHPGRSHIRVAMVHGAATTATALRRLKPVLQAVGREAPPERRAA